MTSAAVVGWRRDGFLTLEESTPTLGAAGSVARQYDADIRVASATVA